MVPQEKFKFLDHLENYFRHSGRIFALLFGFVCLSLFGCWRSCSVTDLDSTSIVTLSMNAFINASTTYIQHLRFSASSVLLLQHLHAHEKEWRVR